MKSIKTKLIIYFSTIILLSSLILGFISINNASKAITEEVASGLAAVSRESAKVTLGMVQVHAQALEVIANIEDIQSMAWPRQKAILEGQLASTGFLEMAILSPNGTAYYTDGSTADLSDRGYVTKALSGERSMSDVIFSPVTNSLVLIYATPIERDGKVVGAVMGSRDGYTLSNITDEIVYGEQGYAYLINEKGDMVAHRDRDQVLNQYNAIEEAVTDKSLASLATVLEQILEEKEGVSSYKLGGEELYAGFAPVEGTNWTLVITASAKEVLASIPKMQRNNVFSITIIMILGVVITYMIGNSITKPIIIAVDHADKIVNLDLTHELPDVFLNQQDEIGSLARGLQTLTNSLREIVGEINNSSQRVAATSEELTASTQQSASGAEEVAKTIEEIAKGATDQAINTETGASKAMLLGDAMENNLGHMTHLNTASKQVTTVVEEGLVEIDNLSKITEDSNNASQEVYNVILRTNESSKEIGAVSNVIASIAEETNLLALNAAIEAARAGDAGRGFAVVAGEIGKLASQSATSTMDINKIVEDLQKNSQEAVATMEKVAALVEHQTNSVVDNKAKYMVIAEAMRESEDGIDRLNLSSKEMEKMKDEILGTLENLSAIAEENAAATEEVTSSMEEQSASVEEISSASEDLSNLAQDLQSVISRFKI